MLITIFFTSYIFGAVYAICELCQRISNQYLELSDLIGQCTWYLFPAEIKRVLPIIILGVQQEVSVECFGSTACNRETFERVNFILTVGKMIIFISLIVNRLLFISGGPWWIFVVYDTS